MSTRLPPAERRYLDTVADRLRALLGDRLTGLYPTGSLALDAYTPGRSDLDLIAVVTEVDAGALAAVAAALDHAVLPCPAAGLEFVLYRRGDLDLAGATGAGYALDLNTGAQLPPKVSYRPGTGPDFWYPIDRAICRQQDRTLLGPAPSAVFAPVSAAALLPVVLASVQAHRAAPTAHGDNTVLNGCRALRFGLEGRWYAKAAAAHWAAGVLPESAALIRAALASHAAGRGAGRAFPASAAVGFLDLVLARLQQPR